MNDITSIRRVESERGARAVVELTGIARRYSLGRTGVTALAGVDLRIERGDFAAIAGPSGSGKTTLLNIIGCIDKPDAGRIVVEGEDVTERPLHRLAALRNRQFGYVFQTFNLLPVLTAAENVEYPLLQRSDLSPAERRERVDYFLNVVGLTERKNNRPNQLSGGQRQRVAIARALAGSPSIVLADEPTANLDKKTGVGILRLMKKINEQLKTTFIFSTHDRRVVDMADHIVKVEDGLIKGLGVRRDGEWILIRPRTVQAMDFSDPVTVIVTEPETGSDTESGSVTDSDFLEPVSTRSESS
jgi:putative ABC transport system ATP-binding protein